MEESLRIAPLDVQPPWYTVYNRRMNNQPRLSTVICYSAGTTIDRSTPTHNSIIKFKPGTNSDLRCCSFDQYPRKHDAKLQSSNLFPFL
ncbi:hypothetical protein R1flu_004251 [Riccia fluitans]|uniref:NADH-plastoquinone oxidoreductase subunit K n=1 Tax=Riccia fluitans TaxID=41844 RepID=A0ABD1YSS4_9MARC